MYLITSRVLFTLLWKDGIKTIFGTTSKIQNLLRPVKTKFLLRQMEFIYSAVPVATRFIYYLFNVVRIIYYNLRCILYLILSNSCDILRWKINRIWLQRFYGGKNYLKCNVCDTTDSIHQPILLTIRYYWTVGLKLINNVFFAYIPIISITTHCKFLYYPMIIPLIMSHCRFLLYRGKSLNNPLLWIYFYGCYSLSLS